MKQQSHIEELFNSITHGIGVGLSAVGLIWMIVIAVKSGDVKRVVSFSVYGASLFLLYLASTLYHGVRSVRAKHMLRICDHASIYLLIAGTYTPFCVISMPHFWGYLLMAILWPLAISGIVFKIFWVDRYNIVSTFIYLLMGWIALIAIKPFFQSLSPSACLLVALGGFMYTFGVIFYIVERIPFNHVIWHLFVLSGSMCHFLAIFWYVLPLVAKTSVIV